MRLHTLSAVLDVLRSYDKEGCATHDATICMCGLTTQVRSNSTDVMASAISLFRSFLVSGGRPDCILDIYQEHIAVDDDVWIQHDGHDVGEQSLILGPSCVCKIDASGSRGTAIISVGADVSHYVASLFRAIARTVARARGGVLVHASGVIHRDRTFLFAGQSESGKSTVARLSSPRTILSDEAVLIRELDGKLICGGTPYGREHPGTNTESQLAACLFLIQSPETHLEPLAPAQALPKLLSNLWGVRGVEQVSLSALELCFVAVQTVPCYELYFRLSNEFWDLIEMELSSGDTRGEASPGIR